MNFIYIYFIYVYFELILINHLIKNISLFVEKDIKYYFKLKINQSKEHSQLQSATGQTVYSLNQSIQCLKCPPCMQFWHQHIDSSRFNSLISGFNFDYLPSLNSSIGLNIYNGIKHIEHIGVDLLQLVQTLIFKDLQKSKLV